MANEPPEGMKRCRECDGAGEVLAMGHAYRTPLQPTKANTCAACAGKGFVPDAKSVLSADDLAAQSPKARRSRPS